MEDISDPRSSRMKVCFLSSQFTQPGWWEISHQSHKLRLWGSTTSLSHSHSDLFDSYGRLFDYLSLGEVPPWFLITLKFGHGLFSQMFCQFFVSAFMNSGPPCCRSSSAMLSAPPDLREFNAAPPSSLDHGYFICTI